MRATLLLAVFVVGSSGCVTARVSAWERSSGTVMISSALNYGATEPTNQDIDASQRQAEGMCHGPVVYIDEGIAPAGSDSVASSVGFGILVAQSIPKSEFRWTFRCARNVSAARSSAAVEPDSRSPRPDVSPVEEDESKDRDWMPGPL